MKLHEHMIDIAERDSLSAEHLIRIKAAALAYALSRSKKEKDYADKFMEAEINALAAYAAYTGKPFVNTDDD